MVASIGKPCKRDIDAPNNSVCLNNKCKCKPDYTAMTNTDCFKRKYDWLKLIFGLKYMGLLNFLFL